MTFSSILNIVTCISFFQLALVSYFNPAKFNIAAGKWFSLFFFSAGFMMLNFLLYQLKLDTAYARVIALGELSRFAIAPALYLAVHQLISANKVFKAKSLFHFIPVAVFLVYMLPFILKTGSVFWYLDISSPFLKQWFTVLISVFVKGQLLVYWALSFYDLYCHQKNIRQINADLGGINLKWLQGLLLAVAAMLFAWYASGWFKMSWVTLYSPLIYLAGVLIAGYFLLAQKEVYSFDRSELDEVDEVINPVKNDSTGKRLSDEVLQGYKEKVLTTMQRERVYLNSELNLPELAAIVDVSTNDLSYVLNTGLNMNFFQFLNSYRVKEAQRLMLSSDSKYLNMLGIAYSSGFNSKTTFNTCFKKETGFSPSQFVAHSKATIPAVFPPKNL